MLHRRRTLGGEPLPHVLTKQAVQQAKDDMAKHAVRVAVRNTVKVVAVSRPPSKAHQAPGNPAVAVQGQGRPELLSGVAWDDGRKVWLINPVPVVTGR